MQSAQNAWLQPFVLHFVHPLLITADADVVQSELLHLYCLTFLPGTPTVSVSTTSDAARAAILLSSDAALSGRDS